jgi:MFS family permease
MALFCTLGFQNAFGVFQAFYHDTILRDHSEFDIAWIGSLLTFMIFFFAAPAGVLVDRVGPTVSGPRRGREVASTHPSSTAAAHLWRRCHYPGNLHDLTM